MLDLQRFKSFQEGRGDHQHGDAFARWDAAFEMAEILLRYGRCHHGRQLFHNAIGERHGFRKTRGFHEAWEGHHHIHPIIGGCEGHFDFGDNAVRAIGVIGFFNLRTTQFQNSWYFFHGDHAQAQHIARFAEGTPHAGTSTGRTAGHKAANSRGALR